MSGKIEDDAETKKPTFASLFQSSGAHLQTKPHQVGNVAQEAQGQSQGTPASSASTPWTLVDGKFNMPSATYVCHSSVSSEKKKILATNKFFVPSGMEKALHKPQPSAHKISSHDNLREKGKMLSHKRNQRHKRQRAKKQASAKAAAIERRPDKVAESSKKLGPHDDKTEEVGPQLRFGSLPQDATNYILSFLRPLELLKFGECCKWALNWSLDSSLWHKLYTADYPAGRLSAFSSTDEWKLGYQLEHTGLIERYRCSHTKKTFFEEQIGCGVDFSVNPKLKTVDHISLSQDLLCAAAFKYQKIRTDVFANSYKLFLPIYFSREHFEKSLPRIKRTIVRLCPESRSSRFEPFMVLDVLPKIMNTSIVLVSDEGLAASMKSFFGFLRIHRLFLALAEVYPEIKQEALRRLKKFALKEEYRSKTTCPSLGNILPLMMIVDEKCFSWRNMCFPFITEMFDRAVLWICKTYPKLEITHSPMGEEESEANAEERVILSHGAMLVSLRLTMFHVYFLRAFCRGTAADRSRAYDIFFGALDPIDSPMAETETPQNETSAIGCLKNTSRMILGLDLSFSRFNKAVSRILAVETWQEFFKLASARCPASKLEMAQMLRQSVRNSRRKKYHKAGMNFSLVQASGTSRILSKGQTYSESPDLRRVTFYNNWTFSGGCVYLDATCLIYRGKRLVGTIDYQNTVLYSTTGAEVVVHSGDVMSADGGTHTIEIDLDALDSDITCCVFVISAWAGAKLSDMVSASISFADADAGPGAAPLCVYDLDAQDKVAYLTSVIMCKLYRNRQGSWHVLAIGDARRGSADNYGPIYSAVEKYAV